ncbi:GIY-YIG nuclease family protein [Radiobacillus sp. PE A8.2]|uniref:GIY-YIG nuclease family protein n=1 Tax=Radiobacillus sp. PE A8.2 TaxID=3380349 RepID=UPI0038905C9A
MQSKQQILGLYAEKKGKGITNKQLAKEVGLNPATISRWFNFKINLSEQKELEIRNYIKSKVEHIVYRFIGENDHVIYVGKTSKGIDNRLRSHIGTSVFEFHKYLKIEKIDYIELDSSVDATILELFLINKHDPEYNKQGTLSEKSSLNIPIPCEWKVYPINEFKRMLRKRVSNKDNIDIPKSEYKTLKGKVDELLLVK